MSKIRLFSFPAIRGGFVALLAAATFATPGPARAAFLAAEHTISVCGSDNTLVARPRLCNDSAQIRFYSLQFASLAAGIYPNGFCSVAGPAAFDLREALPLMVAPAGCVDLHLGMERPPEMTAGQTACFQIDAQDLASGEVLTAQSVLFSGGNFCGHPLGAPATTLPAGRRVPMKFSLQNFAAEQRILNYRFESLSSTGPPQILLGAGAVGEGLEGQVVVPAEGAAQIAVDVALTTFEPGTRHNLLLRDRDADTLLSSRAFRAFAPGCTADESTLCLNQDRFEVKIIWRDFRGQTGSGHAENLTGDTGYFWFFSPNNVEVILKVLDGRYINDSWWVFFGALSTIEYTVTVRDTYTGESKTFYNPQGILASVGDIEALPGYETMPLPATLADGAGLIWQEKAESSSAPRASVLPAALDGGARAGTCVTSNTTFCVQDNRFRVEASWTVLSGSGFGEAQALTAETGYFWFFSPNNIELVLKVLDGRSINGHWWVFFGALSDVDYTLKVTDTVTGAVQVFHNPQGRLASFADIEAFID